MREDHLQRFMGHSRFSQDVRPNTGRGPEVIDIASSSHDGSACRELIALTERSWRRGGASRHLLGAPVSRL